MESYEKHTVVPGQAFGYEADDALFRTYRVRWHLLSELGLERKLNHCMNVLSSSLECTSGLIDTKASMQPSSASRAPTRLPLPPSNVEEKDKGPPALILRTTNRNLSMLPSGWFSKQ